MKRIVIAMLCILSIPVFAQEVPTGNTIVPVAEIVPDKAIPSTEGLAFSPEEKALIEKLALEFRMPRKDMQLTSGYLAWWAYEDAKAFVLSRRMLYGSK